MVAEGEAVPLDDMVSEEIPLLLLMALAVML